MVVARCSTRSHGPVYHICRCQYLLRGLPFPPKGGDIEAAMKMLTAKATEQGNRILSDPKLAEEVGRELLEDTAAALEEADQTKKLPSLVSFSLHQLRQR
jgi:hypothetical protein